MATRPGTRASCRQDGLAPGARAGAGRPTWLPAAGVRIRDAMRFYCFRPPRCGPVLHVPWEKPHATLTFSEFPLREKSRGLTRRQSDSRAF